MVRRQFISVRPRLSASIAFASTAFPLLAGQVTYAAYEAPNPAYNAPANYYSAATGTGPTLRIGLHNIISVMTPISYGDVRYAFPSTDADPNTPGNILLVYTGQSFPSAWGSGSNYGREHLVPVSWLGMSDPSNTYKGIASDLFELRPINQGINSSRSNDGYGTRTPDGTYGHTTNSLWYPGDWDAGEVARSMFYMATRYYDGTGTPSINNLQLTSGQPANASFQIGDLTSLLVANYSQGVDNFERQRNQVIYSGWKNANTGAAQKQGNRNPYIDHPEYVWAVFGSGPNDSQISVNTPDAAGASTNSVNLGRVIKNGAFGNSTVTINKTGADPTTFDLTASGNAVTVANGSNLMTGTGQPMNYGSQAYNVIVGLNATTATTGLKSGSLTVDNTDLTTAGAGKGSADGNDIIQVSGSVLDKRVVTASKSTVNLGTVITGATISSSVSLATTGDDNSFTRVNVAGSSSPDANGMQIIGSSATFNSATSSSNRSLTGTLNAPGAKSGSLALTVSSAENAGAGLAGEGSYSPISIAYQAIVLSHSNASFDPTTNSDTYAINFGALAENSDTASSAFDIANLITTAGFTAGLDLTNITVTGNDHFSTDASTFMDELAGDERTFHAFFDTSTVGVFSASYTFTVADQHDLTGAAPGTALTLNLSGQVVAVPEPAAMLVFISGFAFIAGRRRRSR